MTWQSQVIAVLEIVGLAMPIIVNKEKIKKNFDLLDSNFSSSHQPASILPLG